MLFKAVLLLAVATTAAVGRDAAHSGLATGSQEVSSHAEPLGTNPFARHALLDTSRYTTAAPEATDEYYTFLVTNGVFGYKVWFSCTWHDSRDISDGVRVKNSFASDVIGLGEVTTKSFVKTDIDIECQIYASTEGDDTIPLKTKSYGRASDMALACTYFKVSDVGTKIDLLQTCWK